MYEKTNFVKTEYEKYIYQFYVKYIFRHLIEDLQTELYLNIENTIIIYFRFFKFYHSYTFEDIICGLLTIKTTTQRVVTTKNGNVNFDDKKINRRILLFIATKKSSMYLQAYVTESI